jgi:tryptophan synthase alpha chain
LPSLLYDHLRGRLDAGQKLLVPFLTAGYPDDAGFLEAARAAADAGADVIEIGIPFSDPLADGPTIQRTSQRALERGASIQGILHFLFHHHLSIRAPIVLMTYMNPVHAIGVDVFCELAADAGVAGVLVSDLPPEEMPHFAPKLREHGIDRIILIAPTTLPERVDTLVDHASGYVYLITRTGVTGAGGSFSSRIEEQVARIRSRSSLPIVAGFGIRSVEDVRRIAPLVDGVVIGARLLEVVDEAGAGPGEIGEKVRGFLRPIREALDSKVQKRRA